MKLRTVTAMSEAMYHAATLGDRMCGHKLLRIAKNWRVLFRVLNVNATMGISLALPGFRVIALDGNSVPTQATVDGLKLDVAERAVVTVEMNNPGIWAFGSTDDDNRKMGMGVVVEYENRRGEPQWIKPEKKAWDYAAFARKDVATQPDETMNLKFEKKPRRPRRLYPLDHQRQVMA